MVAQLTFPAEVDAAVGGLVNYNPYSPQPADDDLALRAAHRAQQPHLRGDPLAGRRRPRGRDGNKLDPRHPRRREVERRPALHGQGRRLHLQPRQAVPGRRQGRRVERHLRRRRRPRSWPRATRSSSPSAATPPRSTTGIIETKILPEHVYGKVGDPTEVRRQDAGVDRSVQGRHLQRPPPHPRAPRRLLAGRQGQGPEDRPRGQLRRRAGGPQAPGAASSTPTGARSPTRKKTFVERRPQEQPLLLRAQRHDGAHRQRRRRRRSTTRSSARRSPTP